MKKMDVWVKGGSSDHTEDVSLCDCNDRATLCTGTDFVQSVIREIGTNLTLYHTFLTFNGPEEGRFLKTFLEKEKMLVTSIFSFS